MLWLYLPAFLWNHLGIIDLSDDQTDWEFLGGLVLIPHVIPTVSPSTIQRVRWLRPSSYMEEHSPHTNMVLFFLYSNYLLPGAPILKCLEGFFFRRHVKTEAQETKSTVTFFLLGSTCFTCIIFVQTHNSDSLLCADVHGHSSIVGVFKHQIFWMAFFSPVFFVWGCFQHKAKCTLLSKCRSVLYYKEMYFSSSSGGWNI